VIIGFIPKRAGDKSAQQSDIKRTKETL